MLGRVFDFLFPLECIACGKVGTHCCEACVAMVPLSPRFWSEPGLRASAAFAYGHPLVRTLLHDVKFEGWTCVRPAISLLARKWAVKIGGGFCPWNAVVIPVPLHSSRLRERGFNQAAMLARAVADPLDMRVRESWLTRVIRTKPQTGSEDRERNVAAAFNARLPRSAAGLPILLVDDVWTSGATMRECAKALKTAGAGPVYGFALAWGNRELHNDARTP